jgi:hypothetical protein
MLDNLIYWATAPIRWFGRSRAFRAGVAGIAVLGASFYAALWAIDRFVPTATISPPALATLPPLADLPPVTRASYVIAPVAVALSAIRASLDAAAPRQLADQNGNPVSSLLSKADIGIIVARGPFTVNGAPNDLAVGAPLNSSLKITGQIAGVAGNVTNALTSLIDSGLGKNVGGLTSKVLDQRADVRGQVTIHSRPALTSDWRLEPNLTAQIALGDSAVSLAGIKINVANEARPLIEKMVNEQVAELETRLRHDTFIERSAREQWTKMCRAIPLGGGKTGLPQLWLEMRPVRAAAAQPRIGTSDVMLTVGVQAETRITPAETKPSCPFPAKLQLVPPMQDGKLAVGLPVDVPFTEINTLLETQLKGRRYPEDDSTAMDVEVLKVKVGAVGERLLIALDVKAREKKSWFGFGTTATVQIWGKPVLDTEKQILRLTDTSLAVESEAAFGLLGAAARTAMPHLQKALAEKAVLDLKPFAADAKKKITAALADFQHNSAGVQVNAAIDDVRLTGLAFDSKTLRVIAEAGGNARDGLAVAEDVASQLSLPGLTRQSMMSFSRAQSSSREQRVARHHGCPGQARA